MALATRSVVSPSPRPRPSRGRALVAASCGALIGLVVGTAVVVFAPAIGRDAAVDPPRASAREGAHSRPHRGHLAGVSAVLMPAAEAGLRPLAAIDGERDAP